MSIFDKAIGGFFVQAADLSEFVWLKWDPSTSIVLQAGTALASVQRGGKAYTFKGPYTPAPPPVAVENVLEVKVGPGLDVEQPGDAFVLARDQGATLLKMHIMPLPGAPDFYMDTETKTKPSPKTGRGFYGTFDCDVEIDSIPVFDANGKRLLPRLGITDASKLYYRKAVFIPYGNFTMRGIEMDGSPNGAGNSYQLAPVRPEPTARKQAILIEDCHLHGWANAGGLGTFSAGCTWTERRNYVHDSGTGDGTEHGIYVAVADEHVTEDCLYVGCAEGHLSKSRAKRRTIRRSRFLDNDASTSSFGVDIPEGAALLMEDVTILRGPKAHNGPALAFGEELKSAGGIVVDDDRERSIKLRNLLIVSTTPSNTPFLGTVGIWNRSGTPIDATGTRVFGPDRTAKMSSPAGLVPIPGDVTVLDTMPAIDWTSPVFAAAA